MVREYWEHKGYLFFTPLTISLILVLLSSIAIFQAASTIPVSKVGNAFQLEYKDGSSIKINPYGPLFNEDGNQNQKKPQDNETIFGDLNTKAVSGMIAVATFFGALLSFFYLSQSLYSDRIDRSILFWRSLPVNEWEVIGSKLLTAMVFFPVVFSVFAIIATVLCFFILYIVAFALGLDGVLRYIVSEYAHFNLLGFLRFFLGVSMIIIFSLPLYCWFLFSSAASRKSPLLIAIGIPLAIVIAEAVILHTDQFGVAVTQFSMSVFSNVSAILNLKWLEINITALFVSILISAVLLIATHWLRINRYEM